LRVSVSLEGKPLFQCAVTVGRRFQSSAPRFRSSAARFRPLRRDLGRSMDVSVQFLSHHLLQIQVSNRGSTLSPIVWCITDHRSIFPTADRASVQLFGASPTVDPCFRPWIDRWSSQD